MDITLSMASEEVQSGTIKAPGTLTDAERDALLQHVALQNASILAWQEDLNKIVAQVMASAKGNPMFAMMMPDGMG